MQHGRAPGLFNEGDEAMWYVLWLVVTPTLTVVFGYYNFRLGVKWAIEQADKEMIK